jgi:polyhydroxyalkanoate synthase
MKGRTWDDYIENGPIRAIEVVRQISGAPTINTLGFCVGGTILATALAVLAARGQHPAASLTLLTTLLDFQDTGILDIFVDEPSVQVREVTIGEQAPSGPGLLKGQELATTFSFLRPNDLVWNYVVGNYLKGETPHPFDLLYWNGDSTNLPGPMYCWYLRHMYLQNELRKPGRLTVCGERVDLVRHQGAGLHRTPRARTTCVPWTRRLRAACPCSRATRARFVLGASRPHRRRHQPAGGAQAQPLDARHPGRRRAGLARRRRAEQHAGRLGGPPAFRRRLGSQRARMVAAPTACGSRQPQGHRARAGP